MLNLSHDSFRLYCMSCILTSKQVLHMPFPGWNQFFGVKTSFSIYFRHKQLWKPVPRIILIFPWNLLLGLGCGSVHGQGEQDGLEHQDHQRQVLHHRKVSQQTFAISLRSTNTRSWDLDRLNPNLRDRVHRVYSNWRYFHYLGSAKVRIEYQIEWGSEYRTSPFIG